MTTKPRPLRRGRTGGQATESTPLAVVDVKPSDQIVGRGRRLSTAERSIIAYMLDQGKSCENIAAHLGRSPSTITREVNRNTGADGIYRAGEADVKATARLARPKMRKLDANPLLRAEVIRLLVNKAHPHLPWHSPKQISDKLKVTYPNCEEMNISHEAIYQALYVQAAGSLRQELKLEKALRTGRKGRKARSPLAGSTLTKQRRNWVQDAHIFPAPTRG